MFLTSIIEKSCWKSLCDLKSESRKDPLISVLQHSSAPKSWKTQLIQHQACAGVPCFPGKDTVCQAAAGAGLLPAEFAAGALSEVKEGSNDLCMSWMTSTRGRCMDFWYHTHYILAQIRWNCSGSQSSCHHQLQDTPPQKVCEQGRIRNGSAQQIPAVAPHSIAAWWDEAGWALHCVPASCWSTLAGSCPPTAIKELQGAQQPRGSLTMGAAHRSLLLLKRQGSPNEHKTAVRKIEGLKYCRYEGDKNKKTTN